MRNTHTHTQYKNLQVHGNTHLSESFRFSWMTFFPHNKLIFILNSYIINDSDSSPLFNITLKSFILSTINLSAGREILVVNRDRISDKHWRYTERKKEKNPHFALSRFHFSLLTLHIDPTETAREALARVFLLFVTPTLFLLFFYYPSSYYLDFFHLNPQHQSQLSVLLHFGQNATGIPAGTQHIRLNERTHLYHLHAAKKAGKLLSFCIVPSSEKKPSVSSYPNPLCLKACEENGSSEEND